MLMFGCSILIEVIYDLTGKPSLAGHKLFLLVQAPRSFFYFILKDDFIWYVSVICMSHQLRSADNS